MCSRIDCGRKQRKAFSLVELLVVVVIIGILASTVTLGVRNYLIVSKQNAAKLEISKMIQALDSFYAVYDRYPSNEEGIEILTQPTEKFVEGLTQQDADRSLAAPLRVQPARSQRSL